MSEPDAPDLLAAGLGRVSFPSMGTTVSVLAPTGREAEAARVVAGLFATWDAALSRFKPESELSRLNAAAGTWVRVSPLLLAVLQRSLEWARRTGGLFDPTVERALVAAGYDRTHSELPEDRPAELSPRPAGAWRQIGVDGERVRLPEGSGLDFGGIAKGMAVDAAADLLLALPLETFAVDAGGDLRVEGTPPAAPAWTAAVETATGDLTVTIDRGALATSSVLGRRWRMGGREMHHLIDPRSGLPATTGVVSVTCAAGRCAEAELGAKTALLLGERAGRAYLESAGLDGLLSLTDGTLVHAGRWPVPEASV